MLVLQTQAIESIETLPKYWGYYHYLKWCTHESIGGKQIQTHSNLKSLTSSTMILSQDHFMGSTKVTTCQNLVGSTVDGRNPKTTWDVPKKVLIGKTTTTFGGIKKVQDFSFHPTVAPSHVPDRNGQKIPWGFCGVTFHPTYSGVISDQ